MQNRFAKFLQFIAYLVEDVDYKKMPYKKYLHTYHWQMMRNTKLNEVGRSCQVCNSKEKPNVHHRTYERLGNEKLVDLTVLCEECHSLFHKHGKLKRVD